MMQSPILQVLYGSKANLDEGFLLDNDSHKHTNDENNKSNG